MKYLISLITICFYAYGAVLYCLNYTSSFQVTPGPL